MLDMTRYKPNDEILENNEVCTIHFSVFSPCNKAEALLAKSWLSAEKNLGGV